ncbi:MAG TPA: DUF2752 domain-containing protein [Mucilaginibacter sp.]|jgi:hypothetical protein|nr:DUF2752 domain-containing protein [Mucilaginibacter sp.]
MPVSVTILQIFCSRLLSVSWLQNHLLPCPFKYITGIECPGCGFQRSVIALIQGKLHQSLQLYPAAIPLLIFFTYGFADKRFNLDTPENTIKKTVSVLMGIMVLGNYVIRLWNALSAHR